MTTKAEQGISVHGVYFENPLRDDVLDAITTIAISRKRLELIQTGMCSVAMNSGGSTEDFKELLQLGNDLANTLMPNHVDNVLRETLTPNQYQRALRANQEGKTLKFSKAKR